MPGEAAALAGAIHIADALGHSLEAAAPLALALAALAIAEGGAAGAEVAGCGPFAGEFAATLEPFA